MEEKSKRVHGKDLHDELITFRMRMDSDRFNHGDIVQIKVEKIQEADDE